MQQELVKPLDLPLLVLLVNLGPGHGLLGTGTGWHLFLAQFWGTRFWHSPWTSGNLALDPEKHKRGPEADVDAGGDPNSPAGEGRPLLINVLTPIGR